MGLLKNLAGKKDKKITSYADFWEWFQSKAKDFHKVVSSGGDFEKDFFDIMAPKLAELRDGYFYMSGMLNDTTAELVIIADGKIINFVFVEELVSAAPSIPGWKFTAHKPELDIENVGINMEVMNSMPIP